MNTSLTTPDVPASGNDAGSGEELPPPDPGACESCADDPAGSACAEPAPGRQALLEMIAHWVQTR